MLDAEHPSTLTSMSNLAVSVATPSPSTPLDALRDVSVGGTWHGPSNTLLGQLTSPTLLHEPENPSHLCCNLVHPFSEKVRATGRATGRATQKT